MRVGCLTVLLLGCGRIGFTDDPANQDGAVGPGCSATFDLCDDFEAGFDTSLWETTQDVTLDPTFAHRGTNSIHVVSPAFGGDQTVYRQFGETRTLSSGPTRFWVRAWFWLETLTAGDNRFELVAAHRPGDEGNYVFVYADRAGMYGQFEPESLGTSAPPTAAWFCLVFEVLRTTSATGLLVLSGDVTPISLVDIVTDSPAVPITHVSFGIGFASPNAPDPQPALSLWIDDVIVHSAPVTCAD